VLHAFAGGPTDGTNPQAALIQATDGNFYGTTAAGGIANAGTVFEMTPSGNVTVLHAFAGGPTDGADPQAALIQATDGNFYGTTKYGGSSVGVGQGTVFRMTPDGTVTVLHAFAFQPGISFDGSNPTAALLQGMDGNFYGTTSYGGFWSFQTAVNPGFGTVFKMTPSGTVTVLSIEGFSPHSALIQATDGNFYGTTYYGCCAVLPPCLQPSIVCVNRPPEPNVLGGRVFKMTTSGTFTVLHEFASGSTDGGNPLAALIQGTDGNFYGTTAAGGAQTAGTVFKMTPSGTVTVLHAFTPGLRPKGTDMDGDGKVDLTVYRPSSGTWYVRYSSLGYSTASADAFQWGLPGDVPISGDFDGDGKTELAVFRPSNGTWYIRYSSLGYNIPNAGVFQWGLPGDIPVTRDFDGDGKTELTVYRPSSGEWFIRYSSLGYATASADYFQWGLPGDIPIAGDFDGDRRADLAVYRPSSGEWFIRYSSRGYSTANFDNFQWGLPGDVPTVADFDGDGRTELTVFRPTTGEWFIRLSSLGYSVSSNAVYQWGLPGDALVK
jgi:uncharacterized repeat protein (TIGR03803 family)